MRKFSTYALTSILMIMLMSVSLSVEAKKGGGFGGKSSFSSPSRSISIGGSKPSTSRNLFSSGNTTQINQRNISVDRKVSGATTPIQPIKVDRNTALSSLGKKGATGDQAGLLFKDFQRKSQPINPKAKLNTADVEKVFTPQYRQNRRQEYYSGYNPSPASHYREVVHVNHSGGYGMWDYMMFDAILDNVGDRQMYYHHQNDQAFRDWRNDANAACAAGDTDVCDKLKDLDREMAEYKAKGIQQKSDYITPGIDPDIYETNNIDPTKLPEIKLCTGSLGSDYNRYANELTKVTKLKVKTIATNGSADAIAKLATGECDLGFTQDDLLPVTGLNKIVSLTQLEVGMMICPKDAKFNSFEDLKGDTTVYVGSDQTGSQFTANKLRDVVSSFSRVHLNTDHSVMEAVGLMTANKKDCLFAVSTPDLPAFKELDKSGNFVAVPLMDKEFKGGKPTYTRVVVDKGHFKNLTQDQYIGWGEENGTDTIGVPTSLIAPQNWVDQNKQLYDLLLMERVNLQASLH